MLISDNFRKSKNFSNPLVFHISLQLSLGKNEPFPTINIGNDVFIGYESLIMSGVTVGHGAKIGARSLVIHDVPPYTTVGGVPAKVINQRFSQEIIDLLLEICWWDLPTEVICAIAPMLQSYPTLEKLNQLKDRIKQLNS